MSTVPIIPGMNMPEADPIQMDQIQKQALLNQVSQSAVSGQQAPVLAQQQQRGAVKAALTDYFGNLMNGLKGRPSNYQQNRNAIADANVQATTAHTSAVTQQMGQMITLPNGTQVPFAVAQKVLPEFVKNEGKLDQQQLKNEGGIAVANINQGIQVPLSKEIATQAGVPELAGTKIGTKALNALLESQGKNKVLQAVGSRVYQIDKSTGQKLVDLGENPQLTARIAGAEANARAKAKYHTVTFQDSESGELRTGNSLEALQSGQPTVTTANGDKISTRVALANDITQSLKNVKEKTHVLDTSTAGRALISAALADPEATTTKFVQGSIINQLNPDEQDYVINVLNAREQIMGLRKTLGGTGSDAQAAKVLQTIPGGNTASKAFADKQIDTALGVVGRLNAGRPNLGSGTPSKPAAKKGDPLGIF